MPLRKIFLSLLVQLPEKWKKPWRSWDHPANPCQRNKFCLISSLLTTESILEIRSNFTTSPKLFWSWCWLHSTDLYADKSMSWHRAQLPSRLTVCFLTNSGLLNSLPLSNLLFPKFSDNYLFLQVSVPSLGLILIFEWWIFPQ